MYPLCDLFNLSLSTCGLPSTWKCAIITLLYKGGDPHDINNYCPISIVNSVAKIFEKQITDINILIIPRQSGFTPNSLTTTTLLKFTNYLFTASENGKFTGAIFLDLTKVFDIVDHYLHLDKGISQYTHTFIIDASVSVAMEVNLII